jgi:hypothetical protein
VHIANDLKWRAYNVATCPRASPDLVPTLLRYWRSNLEPFYNYM